MTRGAPRHRLALVSYTGFLAASGWLGAVGLVSGLLPLPHSLARRLPFHSPVFGGIALACVVAVPMTVLAVMVWRRRPRIRDGFTLGGLLLVAWIAVETAILREFNPLQPIYLAAGLVLILVGDRQTLRQVADVLAALPLFLIAPVLRHWHRRWGATKDESTRPMPGDDLVPASHFTATRAITIDASPELVWPWLVQVGFGRGGFYSYDLLDNLGRPSASTVLPEWQQPHAGDVAAPMTNPPTDGTSFRIAELRPARHLVWSKPLSSWAWTLDVLPGGRTRLVTRLRQHHRATPAGALTFLLDEFGDFAMMRKMLLGIKCRAEARARPA